MEDEVVELEYRRPSKYIHWKFGLEKDTPANEAPDVFAPVQRLGINYLDNLCAYVSKSKIKDPYTGQELDPDEKLMRAVESEINIHEALVDDFRKQIMAHVGTMAHKGLEFRWDSNQHLAKGLMAKYIKDVQSGLGVSKVLKSLKEDLDY